MATIARCRRLSQTCRQFYRDLTWAEISGSVGDLGTFVPLAIALARQDAIYLGPALFGAGLSNVMTGVIWDVPMCVQPMKSIAAVAIAEGLTRHQVTAAGIWMGIFLCGLSVTNGIEVVNQLVPQPVVSGIQMGVGINLAIRGILMIQALEWWVGWDSNSDSSDGFLDCIALAVIVALFCLYLLREQPTELHDSTSHDDASSNLNPAETESGENALSSSSSSSSSPPPTRTRTAASPPVGLYLFGLGVILALIHLVFPKKNHHDDSNNNANDTTNYFLGGIVVWALQDMSWHDWKQGLLQGAIPQLPLTTLNSVVSVCCLAHTLYPEKRKDRRRSTITTTLDDNDDDDTEETAISATTAASTDAVVSRKEVSWSVGLMNLVLCPLGAMPCCHGAGGLAGQHKFGARHGASVVFLGLNKMMLAIMLGGSVWLVAVLDALPNSILGLMLVVCGHELALMGLTVLIQSANTTQSSSTPSPSLFVLRKNSVVALVTVILDVGLHKTHYAALGGWVTYMVYAGGIHEWRQQWFDTASANYSRIDDSHGRQELDTPGTTSI